ncbi:MAG: ribonuclease H-like domain-containing protein [Nitrospiraceae bacterium]|nr:ribonuclease H-like domain-containing protein [Nitrospiraceae bacterium]
MIRNTFSLLNGIGEKIERRLWDSGILTWDDFIKTPQPLCINPERKPVFDHLLSTASKELDKSNAEYFASAVKRKEHWRLYDVFKNDAVCLDIETNGFMPDKGGYATMVGLYNGYDYKCFIKGIDLTAENLMNELSAYKYLITFYGVAFDIPFLLRTMPDLKFDIPHFDLCFSAKKIGFTGGFKKLEEELGVKRDESVKGMNGYDAVRIWEYYIRTANKEHLDLLKIYNKEDTVNLHNIADTIYRQLRAQTGIDKYLQ